MSFPKFYYYTAHLPGGGETSGSIFVESDQTACDAAEYVWTKLEGPFGVQVWSSLSHKQTGQRPEAIACSKGCGHAVPNREDS